MSRNEVQEQQPTAALATYLLLVRSCFFVSRSPKDGAHKAELRAPGNTLHNCIFSSRPLSITLVVRHTRTQLLSLLPLYSSALAFPTTSFLSHPQKCYCTIYWHVRVFCVFFSLQNHFILRLDSYYFHEIPTAKFSLSSSEISLWQTEQTDTKPFLFSCSSWSRSFQGPSGGIQVKSLTVELCVHESLMWADIMAVWATGSDVRSANYAAVLFLIAARSPFFVFSFDFNDAVVRPRELCQQLFPLSWNRGEVRLWSTLCLSSPIQPPAPD